MNRIERLRAAMTECDGYYITSGANIFYYSGFTSADAALVITNDRLCLITDSRYLVQAKKQAADFEIIDIKKGLKDILSDIKAERIGFEEEYLTVSRLERLKAAAGERTFFAAGAAISTPRQIKEPGEIEKIRAAEALGDETFSHLLRVVHAGMTELEVAFEIEMFMRKKGASGVSFETIVASGLRSVMPHGVASHKVIEKGDFLTLDFGCVLDGYCSDMTRTVVVGEANSRQREIYSVVLAAQQAALNYVRDGVACSEVDAVARKVIADAGYGQYFAHSLGHGLGLEIHENPNFSPKSNEIAVSGHVITVEPGIYIEGFGGVRIEDLVAITPEKVVNLTKSEKEFIII